MKVEQSLDSIVGDHVKMQKPPLLEDRERIISICSELLCSRRPLADVLQEIKRLSEEPRGKVVELGTAAPGIDPSKDCQTPVSQGLPVLQEQVPEPQPSLSSSVPIIRPGFMQRQLSFRGSLVAVGLILLSFVAIGGYVQLGTAARPPIPNRQNEVQLLQQLRDRGQLIGRSLRPAIDNLELRDVNQLEAAVKLRVGEAKAVKLLFAPGGGDSFFYAASWPGGRDDLEAERRELTRLGILDRLTASCHNAAPFELLGSEATSGNEGIAVNPLWTPAGCWVVVIFFPLSIGPNTPASWIQPRLQIVSSEAAPQP